MECCHCEIVASSSVASFQLFIGIGHWQHFHIGNILHVVRAAAVPAARISAVTSAVRLDAGNKPECKEHDPEHDAPGLRLLLEELHHAPYGADVLLVHQRDKPRDGQYTRKGNEKRYPKS